MAIATPGRSKEIGLYQEKVRELYRQIGEAVRQHYPGAVVQSAPEVTIDEELTGPYSIEGLEIIMPDKSSIRLVPVGIYNIGARGRVDAHGPLSAEVLVWVQAGGPEIRSELKEKEDIIDAATRPVFPDVPEGWAWSDRDSLIPLTREIISERLIPELTE